MSLGAGRTFGPVAKGRDDLGWPCSRATTERRAVGAAHVLPLLLHGMATTKRYRVVMTLALRRVDGEGLDVIRNSFLNLVGQKHLRSLHARRASACVSRHARRIACSTVGVSSLQRGFRERASWKVIRQWWLTLVSRVFISVKFGQSHCAWTAGHGIVIKLL